MFAFENNNHSERSNSSQFFAGISLILIAILLVAAMLHHPVPHAHGFDDFVQEVKKINALNQTVHGSAIAMLTVMLASLSYVSILLGSSRYTTRLAIISTGLGCASMVIAAMVSGFIVPSYLESIDFDSGQAEALGRNSTAMLRSINQCFDLLGVIGLSAGVGLFGVSAVTGNKKLWLLGTLGLAAAISGIAGLFVGFTTANVHGVIVFSMILGLWLIAAGIHLIRGK